MTVDRAGGRQLPEGCGEQEEMERAGFKVVSGAPTTRAIHGKREEEEQWDQRDRQGQLLTIGSKKKTGTINVLLQTCSH